MNRGCLGFLVAWVASAVSLWITAAIVPGVEVRGFRGALFASVAIGLVNAVIRPIAFVLTLPLTVLTLGLFLLVLNGIMLELADALSRGLEVHGLLPAIFGAAVLSLVGMVVDHLFGVED